MGDNLIFAREFTRTAAEGLELLSAMDDPRAPDAMPVVTAMMTTLQSGAKRLRARHIYTSAQNVLSALHHETDAVLSARIRTLGKLVAKYARGLSELVDETTAIPLQTASDKWESARSTLDALLPTAEPQDADILSRLMRAPISVEDMERGADTSDADVLPFPGRLRTESKAADQEVSEQDVREVEIESFASPLETSLETNFETSVAMTPAPPRESGPQIALEIVMRDVVADALSVARSNGRTISLSYDMGDAQISEDMSESLRLRLGKALSQIIRQALPEGRVGHIDVNIAGEQMHILAGRTAMRVAIDSENTPAPGKPLITQETEDGLREQLAALMDPNDNFGTAS